ncbi:MAG: TraX family protein [Christensenellales bacterium]|nr:TraX family protein [Christensenellales bacterium]
MINRKTREFLTWPLAPTHIDMNQDTDLLKMVGMVSMLIDHAGKMLFPQYAVMRIIGRLAFPIYAYCIAVGCVRSQNIFNYLKRILLIGLISQPFYAVALSHETRAMYAYSITKEPLRAIFHFYMESWATPNIMLTLAMGVLLIWMLRSKQLVMTAAVALLCWLLDHKINYGFRGVLLMVLFYVFCWKWWLSLPIILGYLLWWGGQGGGYSLFEVRFGLQMFSIFALPLIYIRTKSGLHINKWVFYFFYPAHLILIMAFDRFI